MTQANSTYRKLFKNKTPLQVVKDQFGSKDKLVSEVKSLVEQPEHLSKEEFDASLKKASNAKLLNLHHNFSRLKQGAGDRATLLEKVVQLSAVSNAGKTGKVDGDLKNRFAKMTTKRILQHFDRLSARS